MADKPISELIKTIKNENIKIEDAEKKRKKDSSNERRKF